MFDNELFEKLYEEWFSNSSYWYQKKHDTDVYLCEKYFDKIKFINEYNDELQNESVQIQIGAIIAYDQLPRHKKRLDNTIDCEAYSRIASSISISLKKILSTNTELYKTINAYEWCFIFLPYRHLNDDIKISSVITFIIRKYNNIDTSEKDKKIFKRFLKATLDKMYVRKTAEYLKEQIYANKIDQNEPNQWYNFEHILEHCPFQRLLCDFKYLNVSQVVQKFKSEVSSISDENIIVSISGGVDSNVSLFLTKLFFPNNKISAVHINYNNSKTAMDELKFVSKYCSVMGIKLYRRTIFEISRNECHMNGLRNVYEEFTKNVRFDTYKQVEKLFGNDKKTLVLLGHNKDDCFENIITNISLKNNYENLLGVSKKASICDINFWRPLLDVEKNDIISFAYLANIPFLQNSTPSWSARGKIRENILPALENINPDIMNSFFVLSEYIQSSNQVIDKYIVNNICKNLKLNDDKTRIDYILEKDELICNLNVWIKIFGSSKFTELIGYNKISINSIKCFIEFLEKLDKKFYQLQINKKHKYVLKSDINCMFYRTKENKIKMNFIKTIKNVFERDTNS